MLAHSVALIWFFYYHFVNAQGPYPDGSFIYPPNLDDGDTNYPYFKVGSQITLQWNTTYNHSNVYFSQFGNDGQSQQISINTPDTQTSWTVVTSVVYPNLSIPFHFHIVNAEGSASDQASGGFWSSGFYMNCDGDTQCVTGTSTGTAATSTTASAVSLSSAVVTTSSFAPSSSSTSSGSSSTPLAQSNSTLSGGAIAGIVIGSLAGIAAIVAGALFWWKRQKIGKVQPYQQDLGEYYAAPPYKDAYAHHAPDPIEAPTHQDAVEAPSISKPPAPVELG